MLTSRVMRNGAGYASKYLEQSDYYAEGEKVTGYWFGKGAEKLGLTGEVQHEQFERVRAGLHPETSEKLRQRKSPGKEEGKENHGRNLYDFTISAPKSVSIMAGPGGDTRLIEDHNEAVKDALAELERHAATRVRVNKQDTDRITGNLILATYLHRDSRRLDPNLHTHCVAANMTWDQEEEKWKALQAGGIYARSSFLTEVYRNSLTRRIQERGYEIEPRKHGFEIAGIPQSLIDKYSQGSKEKEAAIAAFVEKNGREPTNNEISVLVRDTRPDKMVHISTGEVRAQQCARLTPDDACAISHTREQADRNRHGVKTHSAEQSLHYALDHVFERVSVAPDHHVLAEALKHGRGQVSLGDLKQTLTAMETSDQVIRAGDEIATRAALERERDMIQLVNQGVAKHERIGKDSRAFQVSDKLSAEQRKVVEFVLDSCDFAVNIEGAAGTGKTTALTELRRGLEAGGRPMIAVAPTMDAAKVLQKEGFPNATTIERLLQDSDAHPELARRAVIVDEAGMVSGRQMHELLVLAKRYDARIIFSGDARQLQSVEASDALRILLKESHLANASVGLREVRRQQTKEYKAAIEALREHPDKGFEKLDKMGAIKEIGLLDRAEAVAEAYRNAKGKTLVVCPTHEEIGRVTEAIRADLRQRGHLGAERKVDRLEPLNWTTAEKQDARNFTPGQVLVFHRGTKDALKYEAFTVTAQNGDTLSARNAQGKEIELTRKQAKAFGVFEKRQIGVAPGDWLSIQANVRDDAYQLTNGERVQVAQVSEQGGILLQDGRTIPRQFRQYTHGYAITAHRSQGKTVDEIIISGEKFTKELFYVAASRGRQRITVFTGDKAKLRESIGVSAERLSALELLRRSARTVDRTRFAERPRTLVQQIGHLMEKVWLNIPRLIMGDRFVPPRDHGREMGR